MKTLATAALLVAGMTTAAQACVGVVSRNGHAAFWNQCGGSVIVKFRTGDGSEGVVGPVAPATEQQVGVPPGTFQYWHCDYGAWASGRCQLP